MPKLPTGLRTAPSPWSSPSAEDYVRSLQAPSRSHNMPRGPGHRICGQQSPMEAKLKQAYDIFVKSFARILENNESVTNPRAAAMSFCRRAGNCRAGLLRKGEFSIDSRQWLH